MFKGWLIYAKEDYEKNTVFARRFLDCDHPQGSIELVFKDDLYYGTANGRLSLVNKQGEALEAPDFAINRAIDPLLSRQLESMGCAVYNSGRIAEICNDKARTYLEVSKLGLPMVDTLFIDRKALMEGDFPLGYPAVLKSVDGRGGREVFLVDSLEELRHAAESLPKDRFVLQKLAGSPGKDVRVFVVGKSIVGAVLRRSRDHLFKANFSLGGTAEPYFLSEKETEMVMRIVDHFDFGMVGIDFIFDKENGFLFNEIEDVVGSRTLSMTSNVDIVSLYLEHIYSVLK